MKTKKNNDKEFIEEAERCLKYFSVDVNKEIIYLTSGGNSCIMKESKHYHKGLVGSSINSIVIAYCKLKNKKTKWK